MSTKTYWVLTVAFAFAGMISYFHINSAFADAHKLNTVFLVAGIAFTVASLLCVRVVAKNWGSGRNE